MAKSFRGGLTIMKVAIYPGSFNPWHKGHEDILKKALCVFDKVVVACGVNLEKAKGFNPLPLMVLIHREFAKDKVIVRDFKGLLVDHIKEQKTSDVDDFSYDVVMRGLRNGHDLQYEMNQQYWNEDLGLEIPIVYFITDRKLSHISSTAIKMIDPFRKD